MPTLDPFQDELPIPPVLEAVRSGPDGASCYRVEMKQGTKQIHAQLPAPTPFWGYQGLYPGPTIEVPRDKRVVIEFVNRLMATPGSFWPFAVPPAAGHAFIPPAPWTVVHLHGSPNPPDSDGWADNAYFPGGSQTHYFPPQESAALLWYHDHANMITRLNVYAGLAGLYLVRDAAAESQYPIGIAAGELPLLLQDRNLEVQGDKFTGRFAYPSMTSINQFLGAFRLVNGVIWPFKKVQARRYRLRILNGANGRFFRLKLQPDGGDMTTKGLTVIGVDGGFLPQPVPTPTTTTADGPEEVLTLAPAERVDVLIDFGPHAGKSLTLVDDDFAGTVPVLRFEVASVAPAPPQPAPVPPSWALSPRAPATPADDETPTVRTIGLYQATIGGMRMHTINGRTFHDSVEEMPVLDTTEIWQFLNVTEEPHPMHLHLVNFKVLDRRGIKITDMDQLYRDKFDGYFRQWLSAPVVSRPPLPQGLDFDGNAILADAYEVSPKDTVRTSAMAITRIHVRFRLRAGMYMYHCHILEHEDMEMMRPLLVVPKGMHMMAMPTHDHGHG